MLSFTRSGLFVVHEPPSSRNWVRFAPFCFFAYQAGHEIFLAAGLEVQQEAYELSQKQLERAEALVEVGSALLCSVGLFWFLTRAFG